MELKFKEALKELVNNGITQSEASAGIIESIKNGGSFTFMLGKRKRILLNWSYNGNEKWNFKDSNSQNPDDYLYSVVMFN